MVVPADIEGFVATFLDSWNSHDPSRLIALTDIDVVWEDPFIPGGKLVGQDALADWLRSIWRSMPDLTFTATGAVHLSPDRTSAMTAWRGVGTMTGPLDPPGYAPTNRRVELTGIDTHTFRGDKLARVVTVTDVMDVGRQIGVAPAPGGLAERASVLLQRLAARRQRSRKS